MTLVHRIRSGAFLSVILSCLLLHMTRVAGAQPSPETERNAREAAAAGQVAMREFSSLVTRENFGTLGFESPEEAKNAVPGEPIEVYSVRLDELRDYDSTKLPESLIRHPPQYFIPVLASGGLRSSVEVARIDNKWKGIRFGSPRAIRTIEKLRSAEAKKFNRKVSSYFVVRIPALRLMFVGHREGPILVLIPTSSHPRFRLVAGEPQPAALILQMLVPAAQKHDTNAPS